MRHCLLLALICFAGTLMAEEPARAWISEWMNTDFSKSSIEFSEIFSGGPPKDGIPAISSPQMLSVANETSFDAAEPVVVVEIDGQTPRAYPIRYLT